MASDVIGNDAEIAFEAHRKKPLALSGALRPYECFDVTPVIGREYPKADLVEFLNAPSSDEILRDLAITVSQRGVVFFRAQNNLTNDLQKKLILRLGEVSGRPATSGLHIHPVFNSERELGGDDLEISTISSVQRKMLYHGQATDQLSPKKQQRAQWHSDISWEQVPADYTCLRLTELPVTGGDTVWSSGYELYDMISEPYQRFLETLSVTFEQSQNAAIANHLGFNIYEQSRGAPENVGSTLRAVHPLVRTNPLTGWKSIFSVGVSVKHINGVTEDESKMLLNWFFDMMCRNHDLQVRYKWKNSNDVAIWDNRSVFHSATFDFEGLGDRFGNRVVGVGEKPYLDPLGTSRRTALQEKT